MAKKTSVRKTTKKKAAKKTSARKTTKKKAAKKTSTRKATEKKVTKKKVAKKKVAKKKATKKTSARKVTKKKTAKKTSARKATTKKGGCSSGKCSAKTLDGRSLVDRGRECRDLKECRRFIIELGDAVEQFNTWLNEMHDQALSAENTRDLYAEQISDLVEAVDLDQKRIAELETSLKKARRQAPKSSASDAVLRKLAALSKDVGLIRSDLKRLRDGRPPTPERRRRTREAKAEKGKASPRTPPTRSADQRVGPFAKYSVLRGAACSLGVGKYGYPPEVCAPADFPRPVAAQILGTYAQHDYGGLAKWALLTGLPIDDGGAPPKAARAKRKAAKKSGSTRKKSTAAGKTSTQKKTSSSRSPTTTTSVPNRRSTKVAASGRSSQQILDQVLLTVARI